MKKLLALILALVLVFSLAACGNAEDKDDAATTTNIKDPVELLNNVWAKFTDNDVFMVFGGDGGDDGMSFAENAAGSFNIANADMTAYLESSYGFPAAEISKIESAATMMHGMMQNNFCGGAYRVKDAADTAAVANAVKSGITSIRFMCGMPEKYVVITVDDLYVVAFYGTEMNINNFKTHIAEAYPQAKVVAEEAIV